MDEPEKKFLDGKKTILSALLSLVFQILIYRGIVDKTFDVARLTDQLWMLGGAGFTALSAMFRATAETKGYLAGFFSKKKG